MTDISANAGPGETIHLDIHVDPQASSTKTTASASATESVPASAAEAPAPALGDAMRAPDGRFGTIASTRRNGAAISAVRLQIGRSVTDWIDCPL